MTNKENFIVQSLLGQIATLNDSLENLKTQITSVTTSNSLPQWVSLAQAIQYKGGGSIGTYRNQPILQPCCGKRASYIGGIKVWAKEDVIEWSLVTTDKLREYASKYNVKLPSNYTTKTA